MTSKLIALLMILVVLMIAGIVYVQKTTAPLERIPAQALMLKTDVPMPDILGGKLGKLIEEDLGSTASANDISPATTVVQAASEALTTQVSAPAVADATPSSPVEDAQIEADTLFLDRKSSEVAYVEFGGSMANKKIAVFHNTQSKEKERAYEGTKVHGLQLESVDPEFVILSYGKAKPLTKPRVDLNIQVDPNKPMDEAQKNAMVVRYKELFGNRMRVAAEEANPELRKNPPKLPSAEEEETARAGYMETYGRMFQMMQSGDPAADPRSFPNPDLNTDETVKQYFETYWPGQVDVSSENVSPTSGN